MNTKINSIDDFREFVNSKSWRFASTYAKTCPHEYIIKTWYAGNELEQWKKAYRYILDHGFQARYYSKVNRYLIVDDHYYFTLCDSEEATVMNRASLNDFRFFNDGKEIVVRKIESA